MGVLCDSSTVRFSEFVSSKRSACRSHWWVAMCGCGLNLMLYAPAHAKPCLIGVTYPRECFPKCGTYELLVSGGLCFIYSVRQTARLRFECMGPERKVQLRVRRTAY